MKNNFEKYIEETWVMKDTVYNDYKKSGLKNFAKFLKKEIKNINPKYRKNKVTRSAK